MPLGADDILAKARDRADLALETNWRSSIKATAVTFVGATGALGALGLGLLQSGLITPVVVWWILGVSATVSGPGVLFFLHLNDLYNKADVLKALIHAQKNFEVLLQQVRDDRNEFESRVAELKHENVALRSAVQRVIELRQGEHRSGN